MENQELKTQVEKIFKMKNEKGVKLVGVNQLTQKEIEIYFEQNKTFRSITNYELGKMEKLGYKLSEIDFNRMKIIFIKRG